MIKRLDLSGTWRFQEDSQGCGEAERWFHYDLTDSVSIPGIMQAQGFGDAITEDTCFMSSLHDNMWYLREEYKAAQKDGLKVPFLSQPPRHYLGKAWYQTEFEVTGEEAGAYYRLFLECTKWNTKVWVDDEYRGSEMSLCTPHEFRLGRLDAGIHKLTVCVDNGMLLPYRPDGHGVSDALGATWNGMSGRVELYTEPLVYINEVKAIPDYYTKRVKLQIVLHKTTDGEAQLTLSARDTGGICRTEERFTADSEEQTFAIELAYPYDAEEWDEYNPKLYTIEIAANGDGFEDMCSLQFGFRRIEVRDGAFYVNDRMTYFRGTHFGGEFPITGYPATDEAYWERIFGICKKWGLNFIRCHSYCPPEAAFAVADRLGMYIQAECGMWNRFSKENDMLDVLKEETKRIIKYFGNHPSFVMLSPSNEPSGGWYEPLMDWVCFAKKYDDRRLYTMQSGWPIPCPSEEIKNTDYLYYHRSGNGPYAGGTIRNKFGWFGKDYSFSLEGVRLPVICHEMGQWCSYPDFDIIDKFTGYLRPGNYEVFKARAEKMGLLSQNRELVMASGRLQAQMYKEDLEANLRTPKIYGFEMLDLHDYLGQGTALVGLLDAFWDEKGYITADEFKHFCAPAVLLLRKPKFVYETRECLEASLELAYFDRQPLKASNIVWDILDESGQSVESGQFSLERTENGKNIPIGEIKLPLKGLRAPAAYTIRARIEGTDTVNEWRFWLYDTEGQPARSGDAVFTRSYREAMSALGEGKKVLYMPSLSVLDWNCPPLTPQPSFWNSQMGPRWCRGLGLLIDDSHPAFRDFPTKDYEEWQWEEIVRCAKGFNLSDFPEDFRPVVQAIDEWNRSYRMALMWEAKVGEGSLLLISSDLEKASENSPAARQLLNSLLNYVNSEDFAPKTAIDKECFSNCFADTLSLKRHGVRLDFEGSTEEIPEENVKLLINGDPNKMFVVKKCEYPFTVTLSWDTPLPLLGINYMPAQLPRDHRGDIREYEVAARINGSYVTVLKDICPTSFDLHRLMFSIPITTDSVQLRVLSGYGKPDYYEWVEEKDGWHCRKHSFTDNSVAIGGLSLITAGDEWQDMTDNEIVFGEVKTTTVEIDD